MNDLQAATYRRLPIFAQNGLCTIDGYRRSRARFTRHFHRKLAEWQVSIEDSAEQQIARQWADLKSLLERARATTRYYRFLPDPSPHRDPVEAMASTLKEIPILEKSVYRARTDDFLASDMMPWQYSERSTSGTTGTALRILDSHERFSENYAAVWRQRIRTGVSLSDPFFSFTGQVTTPLHQKGPPFWRHDRLNGRALFSIYHMSPDRLEHYVEPILTRPAKYIEGYPSALNVMARHLIDTDQCLPSGRLAAIFTSSETLMPHQRDALETAFGAPVFDHYASTEHVVSMTACSEERLHVDEEFGIVEVEPTEETDEWVRGPLIVTGLGVPAAPMIRYRIGDIGTRAKTPCPCGRQGDSFLEIDGRIEDYVMTPDGRLLGRMDHVFKGRYDISEAQIIQPSPDTLRVNVVASADWNDASEAALVKAFRERIGPQMTVHIDLMEQIPREPNGKLRAVKSELGARPR